MVFLYKLKQLVIFYRVLLKISKNEVTELEHKWNKIT